MKKADPAAGVKGDKMLSDNEWLVKATIEEMKGNNMQFVGSTHTILGVRDGNVEWFGLPFLQIEPEPEPEPEKTRNTKKEEKADDASKS
jgi:hypothetical protein